MKIDWDYIFGLLVYAILVLFFWITISVWVDVRELVEWKKSITTQTFSYPKGMTTTSDFKDVRSIEFLIRGREIYPE